MKKKLFITLALAIGLGTANAQPSTGRSMSEEAIYRETVDEYAKKNDPQLETYIDLYLASKGGLIGLTAFNIKPNRPPSECALIRPIANSFITQHDAVLHQFSAKYEGKLPALFADLRAERNAFADVIFACGKSERIIMLDQDKLSRAMGRAHDKLFR